MKFICIYKPIIPDESMPTAIHPTSETRRFRQTWIFEKFRKQFNIEKKKYFVEVYKKSEKAQPARYHVKTRWCSEIRKLALNNNYFVKGRYNVWSLFPEPNNFDIYFLYPLPFTTLVKIVNSIVIGERKNYMYDVIARYLHDMKYPIPNMDSRKLYMKTLFKDLNKTAIEIAESILNNSKMGTPEVFWRYLNIKFRFWNSQSILNTICSKMKDLGSSTRHVRAVLPRNCNIPPNIRKGEKSETAHPFVA